MSQKKDRDPRKILSFLTYEVVPDNNKLFLYKYDLKQRKLFKERVEYCDEEMNKGNIGVYNTPEAWRELDFTDNKGLQILCCRILYHHLKYEEKIYLEMVYDGEYDERTRRNWKIISFVLRIVLRNFKEEYGITEDDINV